MSIYTKPYRLKQTREVKMPEKPLLLFVAQAGCGSCMSSKRFLDYNKIPNICFAERNSMRIVKMKDELEKYPYKEIKDVGEEIKKYQDGKKRLPMLVDGDEVIVDNFAIELYVKKKYLGY